MVRLNISDWWANTVDVLGGAAHAVIDSVFLPEKDDAMPPQTPGTNSSHSHISGVVNGTKNWIFNAGHDIANLFVAITPQLPSFTPMSIVRNVLDKFSSYIWVIKIVAILFGLVLVIMCAEKLLLLCKPFSFFFTTLNKCLRNVAFAVMRACRLTPNDADYVTAISFCMAGSSAHVRALRPNMYVYSFYNLNMLHRCSATLLASAFSAPTTVLLQFSHSLLSLSVQQAKVAI